MSPSMTIVPGSLIIAEYTKLDGTLDYGLFFVIYCEDMDSVSNRSYNITGLKVTSQVDSLDSYCVPLPQDKLPFLEKTSFVMCNKPCSLVVNRAKFLGNVYGPLFKQVYKMFSSYMREVDRQLLCYL